MQPPATQTPHINRLIDYYYVIDYFPSLMKTDFQQSNFHLLYFRESGHEQGRESGASNVTKYEH